MENLSIFQLNVRGINNPKKFDKIKILLSQLDVKLDIIVLGETKLKTSFPSGIYNLNGYDRFNCCRDAKNSGGGLMVFVKKGIPIKMCEKESTTFEKIMMIINVNNKDYKVLSYYRNPISQSLEPFLKDVENEMLQYGKNTIIIGDVNFDANSDNKESERFVQLLRSYDMNIVNKITTRNVSGRIIDHCCINFSDETEVKSYTINTKLSDHNIVITELSCIKKEKEEELIMLERTNWKKLKETFEKLKAKSSILHKLNPNEIANELISMTTESIKLATRTIKFKFNKGSKICKWFNLRIMNAIKRKDSLLRICKKKKGSIELKKRLTQASKKLKKIIKEEKDKFIRRSLQGNDIKKIWRNINELLGRKSKSNKIIAINDMNGEAIYDPSKISENFNEYFIESVTDIKRNLTKSLHPIKEKSEAKTMVLEATTEEEVMQIILSLKTSAPGIDGIKSTHVKALANEITPILVHLINRMMDEGIYPEAFKTAIVTPINKSGKTTDISDYRPISVLTTFNKIAEKIIHTKITSFTDGYLKILYRHQYGYRRKSSTETAALEMINHVQLALDKKMKASLVFMDLKRAFDIVDINKLVLTLSNYGVRGQALKLIENYLSDRQQVVKVNGVTSSIKTFTQGVVQGSVLGSWLFLLFFNSIADLELNGKLFLYADDSVLVNFHKNDEKINGSICNDMKKIINFLNHKNLILNAEKTNFMIIQQVGTKPDNTESIEIQSKETDNFKILGVYHMKRIRETKYLGLIIDEQLKWEAHILSVKRKISNATGVLWKMRHCLPEDAKKRIYKSLVESHLTYMIPIWGSATDAAIKPLQVIQNRALRNVYNLDRLLNRKEMYSEQVEDNLPIRGLFLVKTAGFVYKLMKGMIFANIRIEKARAGSRNGTYLRPTATRTVRAAKTITAIGPRIFNSLTDDVKRSPHLASFKRAIKEFTQQESVIETCFSGEFMNKYT